MPGRIFRKTPNETGLISLIKRVEKRAAALRRPKIRRIMRTVRNYAERG